MGGSWINLLRSVTAISVLGDDESMAHYFVYLLTEFSAHPKKVLELFLGLNSRKRGAHAGLRPMIEFAC